VQQIKGMRAKRMGSAAVYNFSLRGTLNSKLKYKCLWVNGGWKKVEHLVALFQEAKPGH
jgi:hypothetical protein